MSVRFIPQSVRHCLNYIHHYGVAVTLRDALPYLRELVLGTEAKAEQAEDFDARFGTDTADPVWPWDLPSVQGAGAEVHGYQPLAASEIRAAIAALAIDPTGFTFIDLGSGKGRALLVASEFAFGRIVGVELSRELDAIARRNTALYRPERQPCRTFDLVCEDAGAFAFPAEPLVVFMYSPFGQKTMERVLANLAASLVATPRPAYILYVNPQLAHVVDAAPFLRLRTRSRDLAIYEAATMA
jgi:hypothetical protein